MRQILLLCAIFPNLCFANADARILYIKAIEDFSTCGNALMPWSSKSWQPDEIEKPYILQAKMNQIKMQSEIDAEFYSVANLEKLFVTLKNNFDNKTADITARLKKLPFDEHYIIWSDLFEIEKDARLIRDKLTSDFRLHAEIIKMCSDDLNERKD